MSKACMFFLAFLLFWASVAPAEEAANPSGIPEAQISEEEAESFDLYEGEEPDPVDAVPDAEAELPDDFPVTGDWYADSDGLSLRLCLSADGTYDFIAPGAVSSGSWVLEDSSVILDGAAEYPLEWAGDDALIQESTGLLFSREAPETYLPEDPVPDADLSWFAGYWSSLWADLDGTAVPAWTVGDSTDLFIRDTLVALGGKRFGDIFWNFSFENGQLSASLEDGRLVTISFQRDSLLRLTVSGPEGKDILYLAPAWFDALDSADEDE